MNPKKEILEEQLYTAMVHASLMPEDDKKLYIAVSGGIDSMVLLTLLFKLWQQQRFNFSMAVVHVNHQLRGEASEGDAKLVEAYSDQLGLPFFSTRIDVIADKKRYGTSIQQSARKLRYQYFKALQQPGDRLATAHHQNDQCETFFIRALRGASAQSLSGIPQSRDGYIRPLLSIPRGSVEDYQRLFRIPFREDRSNANEHYIRNAIRHRIIPILKTINPNFLNSISNICNILKCENDYMDTVTNTLYASHVETDINRCQIDCLQFLQLHRALQFRLLHKVFMHFGFQGTEIGRTQFESCVKMIEEAETSKELCLPKGFQLRISYGNAVFEKRNEETPRSTLYASLTTKPEHDQTIDLGVAGKIEIKLLAATADKNYRQNKQKKIARLDIDKLQFPITFRNIQSGDRMQPLGMRGSKAINRIFIDDKTPRKERFNIPLMCYNHDVIWILGGRIAHTCCVDDTTRQLSTWTWHRPAK